MEKISEKKEISVNLPSSYIMQIYKILLVANNRVTWHPDELIPVGVVIKELKTIIEKCSAESSNDEEEKDDEPQEESKEETQEESKDDEPQDE